MRTRASPQPAGEIRLSNRDEFDAHAGRTTIEREHPRAIRVKQSLERSVAAGPAAQHGTRSTCRGAIDVATARTTLTCSAAVVDERRKAADPRRHVPRAVRYPSCAWVTGARSGIRAHLVRDAHGVADYLRKGTTTDVLRSRRRFARR